MNFHRVVFILGAGASKEAGAPLMRDFLDVSDSLREQQTGRTREEFDLVFKAIAELQAVLAKAKIELDNIESVFAAFEMADLFGRLGSLKQEEVRDLTTAIKSVIVTTLESQILLRHREERLQPPNPYGNFVDFYPPSNKA